MKVVVLTTSYPSAGHPVAGSFVATSVELAREAGIEVTVVSPDSFPHFGIAYGGGIANNLRAAPWKLGLVPAFLGAFARAARSAARDADLVHAHWIPSAIAARGSGKPYVLQVWGTDVELARRMPALVRPLVRGARVVLAASEYLAAEARALGARDVAIVPTPVPIPSAVADPEEPPHVLFAGRLSEEKGILEFVGATEGIPRVIVGDGPLRDRVPEAVGFVSPSEIGVYYERAAVVCVPSRREGYGMVAREAIAYGRPVVATDVGGLGDLRDVAHPATPETLHDTISSLLADRGSRRESGERGRRYAEEHLSADACRGALTAAYEEALQARRSSTRGTSDSSEAK